MISSNRQSVDRKLFYSIEYCLSSTDVLPWSDLMSSETFVKIHMKMHTCRSMARYSTVRQRRFFPIMGD